MDSVQFATAYVPTEIEVAGAHVRLFFTLQAAMKMEASLKRPFGAGGNCPYSDGRSRSEHFGEDADVAGYAGICAAGAGGAGGDCRQNAAQCAKKNDAGEWRWEMILLAAKRVLGLTVDEFWHLTPTVFHALLEETIGENEQAPRKVQFADEIGW